MPKRKYPTLIEEHEDDRRVQRLLALLREWEALHDQCELCGQWVNGQWRRGAHAPDCELGRALREDV